MALVARSTYNGNTAGRRKATAAEQRAYGKTTYAKKSGHKASPDAGIVIIFTIEYYHPNKREWRPCTRTIQPIKKDEQPKVERCIWQWNFYSINAAIAYVLKYMHNTPNAVPANKKGLEYFLTENGYWKEGKFHQYDNPDWDNGITFFSQWIIKGGKYLKRYTFEQFKDLEFQKHDYHDPKPETYSRYADINHKDKDDKVHTMRVRTIYGEDAPDTTLQRLNAYRREKKAVQIEYDNQKRHELAMTPKEYRQYNSDIRHMNDDEWHQKYGVDHSYYNN